MSSILLPADERDEWSAEAEMRVGMDGKLTLVPVREWRGVLELRLDEHENDGALDQAEHPQAYCH